MPALPVRESIWSSGKTLAPVLHTRQKDQPAQWAGDIGRSLGHAIPNHLCKRKPLLIWADWLVAWSNRFPDWLQTFQYYVLMCCLILYLDCGYKCSKSHRYKTWTTWYTEKIEQIIGLQWYIEDLIPTQQKVWGKTSKCYAAAKWGKMWGLQGILFEY